MAPDEPPLPPTGLRGLLGRVRAVVFGPPRDVTDPRVFHRMSLVAILAWIGLGADGLSSSAYGPEECYRALIEGGRDHAWLAVFLALASAVTVIVIAAAYSRVIEHFPSGGGGYLVATKLLGEHAGLVSGSALLVDYVLTITVSVASGADALFSMVPVHYHHLKVPCELAILLLLVVLNLRGVKESVTAMLPVFLVFVVTHLVLILGGIGARLGSFPAVAGDVATGLRGGASGSGGGTALLLVFLAAFTRGSGTFTGIEAVSNGLQIMREPRVQTGKRTMAYMAASLAFTAGGLLVCYLLFRVRPVEGQTMNSVLADAFAGSWTLGGLKVGKAFVWLTLFSEGALLFVAAQTGFIDGPRVMANMAVDSWLPRRFASLSDRLTTKDGVMLMGAAAVVLLLATRGSVSTMVVMYAINVFLTFSLTMLGMSRLWIGGRADHPGWKGQLAIQLVGLVLCAAILILTILEKFRQGAWLTVAITAAVVALCLLVRAHYRAVGARLRRLDRDLADLPAHDRHGGEPDPALPTAVLLVGAYGGVGVHSLLSIQRGFPGYFKNVIFVSVAVVDSGAFKGAAEVEALSRRTEGELEKYVALARRLGWNSSSRTATGIDAVAEATTLCLALAVEMPRAVFFAGKLLWKRESWYQRILHNETAFQIERRLQWKGHPMTVLPLRVPEA